MKVYQLKKEKVFLLFTVIMKIQMKFKSFFTFRTVFQMFLFSTRWKWRIWKIPRNKAAPFIQTLLTLSLAIPTGKYSEIIVILSIFMGLTLVRFTWYVILIFSCKDPGLQVLMFVCSVRLSVCLLQFEILLYLIPSSKLPLVWLSVNRRHLTLSTTNFQVWPSLMHFFYPATQQY